MDIDIDFPSDFDPLTIFDATRASMVKNGNLVKHPVGIYFQNIPTDSLTGLAAIPHKEAQDLGYLKIDFLHLTILDNFNNKEEIRQLMKIPPDWSLLQDPEVVPKLFQLGRQGQLLAKTKPQSIQELAETIALIRPGKRELVPAYLKDPDAVRPYLYTKPENGKQYYKKSHAIAYALTIVLQLHLIKGGIIP
jgi:hypothetical protein